MSGWRATVRAELGRFVVDVDLRGDSAPLALIGPNGSGKTTLLRILCGALKPTRGVIELGGRNLFSSADGIDLTPEQRRVGYVPQGSGLFPHLPAVDNVAFGLSTGRRKQSPTSRRRAARAMLREVECAEFAERLPSQLSGGEQQRVALARALVIEPAMLLLDEPLSALDAGARRRLRSFLARHLLSLRRPAIVVTHDVRDVAALDARVCVLEQGRIAQQGTLAELQAAPINDFVAEFVGNGAPSPQRLPTATQ